ncbi:MAG TPA: GNAT family N-acetyltransferase [Kofleriaceae bacterium]
MKIERATHVDDELVTALTRLIPQLNTNAPLPTHDDLAMMLASPSTYLLIACDSDIVGTLTLTLFRTLVGLQGRINTVIVDAAARGHGIGEALTREAMRISRDAGVRRITLSSRLDREPAHRMYLRCGFELTGSRQFHMTL